MSPKYKSITQAASLLYSSQPSISRMIKILEQELGCTLFIRTRKGVALTPEGEELFDHVAPACEELFVGEELLSRSYGLQGDTIRIGASETALRCFLFDNLELFYAEHPAIKLKIYNHTASEALENLKNGNVDLAVVSTPLELVPPMRMTRLLPIQEICICGPRYQHLLDHAIELEELVRYPLITLAKGTRTRAFYENFFERHGQILNPDIEVETSDLVLPGVRANLGIGFIPETFAHVPLEREEVFQLKLKEDIPERYVCLVEDTSKQPGLAARLLIKYLTTHGSSRFLKYPLIVFFRTVFYYNRLSSFFPSPLWSIFSESATMEKIVKTRGVFLWII